MGSRLRSRLKTERGLRAPEDDDFAEVISKPTVSPKVSATKASDWYLSVRRNLDLFFSS